MAGIMKHCCRVSVSLGGVLSPHPLGVLAACLPPRPPTALLLCWAFEQLILVRLTTLALSPSPHSFAFCIARLILWGGDSLAARTWPQWFGCWGIPTCRWWWRRSSSTCATRCGTVRCGAVRYGAVRYGAVRYGTVRCGAVRCGAMREGEDAWRSECQLIDNMRPP